MAIEASALANVAIKTLSRPITTQDPITLCCLFTFDPLFTMFFSHSRRSGPTQQDTADNDDASSTPGNNNAGQFSGRGGMMDGGRGGGAAGVGPQGAEREGGQQVRIIKCK